MLNNRLLQLMFLDIVISLCLLYGCKSTSHTSSNHVKPINNTGDSLLWISMIDSPGVNYYKIVESFDKFWKNREKPTEDDGEGQDIFGKKDSKEEGNRSIQYVFEYKRFLNWQQQNKNLVKPDGTIMTPEELLEQWKKSKNDTLSK